MSYGTRSQARTLTQTTTITASDVREVMNLTTQEITYICERAANLAVDFDLDQAMIDCSLLALNDIISAIKLQAYLEDDLIAEYCYSIADEPLDAWGPDADDAPLVDLPPGTRIRIAVNRNPNQPKNVCDAWMERLGWYSAPQLRQQATGHRVYGTFASGGYGVYRGLYVHPDFDRPVSSDEWYYDEDEWEDYE
jgi:hypothetical protein